MDIDILLKLYRSTDRIVPLINSEIANLPVIMYARLSNRLYGVEWGIRRIIGQDRAVRIACEPADSGK